MDLQLTAFNAQPRGDRTETPSDLKYNSTDNFQGVRHVVAKQLPSAVDPSNQSDGARLQKQGGLFVDEQTRRVYYRLRDPVTGQEDRFPSEAQLRMIASIKAELDKQPVLGADEIVSIPGELLNTKA